MTIKDSLKALSEELAAEKLAFKERLEELQPSFFRIQHLEERIVYFETSGSTAAAG